MAACTVLQCRCANAFDLYFRQAVSSSLSSVFASSVSFGARLKVDAESTAFGAVFNSCMSAITDDASAKPSAMVELLKRTTP